MSQVTATFTIDTKEDLRAAMSLVSLLEKLAESDPNVSSVEIATETIVTKGHRVQSGSPRRIIRAGSGRRNNDRLISDVLPKKISLALKRHFGIEEVRELLGFQEKDLASVPNIGPASIKLIIAARDSYWDVA